MNDTRHTREDLVQVEFELYSHMLREARQKQESEPGSVAARFLEVDETSLAIFAAHVDPVDADAVAIEIGRQAALAAPELLTGLRADEPVTWKAIDLGAESRRVPEYIAMQIPVGATGEAPLSMLTWPLKHGQGLYVRVYARPEHEAEAEAYLAELKAAGRGPASPYFHEIVEASLGQGGLRFRIIELEPVDRGDLILAAHVWDAVQRNVDRMFERMDRLAAAGLGANRGLVLSGPPGTGKSALCKVLAHEYRGRATVTIVSASAGHYVLGEVYQRLNDLGPALVLLEDLDLLVGDRELHERGPLVEFLTVLDGLMTRHSHVVTVATTNDAKMIDDAAVRSARFDQVVQLELPDVGQREAILAVYLRELDHAGDVGVLAERSEGLSGADLREVVRGAVLDAEGDQLTHDELVRSTERQRRAVERLPVGFANALG